MVKVQRKCWRHHRQTESSTCDIASAEGRRAVPVRGDVPRRGVDRREPQRPVVRRKAEGREIHAQRVSRNSPPRLRGGVSVSYRLAPKFPVSGTRFRTRAGGGSLPPQLTRKSTTSIRTNSRRRASPPAATCRCCSAWPTRWKGWDAGNNLDEVGACNASSISSAPPT